MFRNFINANLLAEELGIVLQEIISSDRKEYPNLIHASIETDSSKWQFAGTVFNNNEPRIVALNNYPVEFKPEGNILIYKNIDKPGMLASVSGELASSNINIANLSLGRVVEGDTAITVINLDSSISEELKKSISLIEGIEEVYSVII